MRLPDVNVLVYAFRQDAPNHSSYRAYMMQLVNAPEAFGMCDLVLSGFLRIVTHPRVFNPPSTLKQAMAFVGPLRSAPNCVTVSPGSRHWAIFCELASKAGAKGNLVADAFLAALAIESGCEWITADRDFARFPGLRWRHPLDDG